MAIVLGALCMCGCHAPSSTPFGSEAIELAQPQPPERDSRVEPLYRFHFNGAYLIVGVERFDDALAFAGRQAASGWEYSDGVLSIIIRPTPYGLRLQITNRRAEPLFLIGQECSFIDTHGYAHSIEVRPSYALSPTPQPVPQQVFIPPRGQAKTDLDAITAVYRGTIMSKARSVEERGAFVVTDAPLPIFCSGYFLYKSAEPDVERVKRWAWSQTKPFGVYLSFRSPTLTLGYLFKIQPGRFAEGRDADQEELISSSQPTPFPDLDH